MERVNVNTIYFSSLLEYFIIYLTEKAQHCLMWKSIYVRKYLRQLYHKHIRLRDLKGGEISTLHVNW